ncbi:thrombin-like enzyme acutobin [Malaya genurostris]|uniref:thrombin-like enzyme acutobin n=1 Tax=Malaya genurostris TaxID=325434 RepID=UPI0026F3C425|nr:thrombin-like enzyme acutobin [Malaya genurostris]
MTAIAVTLLLFIFVIFVSSNQTSLIRRTRIISSGRKLQDGEVEAEGEYGGVTASVDEFPYMVSLQYFHLDKYHHYCGGTLLTIRWVLTAAQCDPVSRGLYNVFLTAGEYYLDKEDDGEQVRRLVRFIVNQSNNRKKSVDNIALAFPETPFKRTIHVIPIGVTKRSIPTGSYVGIPGWGSISDGRLSIYRRLMKVFLPTISPLACQRHLNASALSAICILETNMADYGQLERSFCSVDMGSPAVVLGSEAKPTLMGIVSWTPDNCLDPTVPIVLAKLKDFQKWIHRETVGLKQLSRSEMINRQSAVTAHGLISIPSLDMIIILLVIFSTFVR